MAKGVVVKTAGKFFTQSFVLFIILASMGFINGETSVGGYIHLFFFSMIVLLLTILLMIPFRCIPKQIGVRELGFVASFYLLKMNLKIGLLAGLMFRGVDIIVGFSKKVINIW